MKKKKYSMKIAYLAAFLIVLAMLLLQYILLNLNNTREAKNTTKAYLVQAEIVIEKNQQEEELIYDSLENDYTVLVKAVAYYLDHNPAAVQDTDELHKLCSLMSIDDIYIFNEKGELISGTHPEYAGLTFDSGEQISYFKPMLSDKTLSMFQGITPNTAEGKPMVYVMTWNEAGTQLVQIGMEPVRLMEELEANQIETTIDNLALGDNMSIIVADPTTLEVVASKNKDYIGQSLTEVTNLNEETLQNGFNRKVKLANESGYYYCSTEFTDDYCICVFLNHSFFASRTLESLIIVIVYLAIAFFVIMAMMRRLFSSLRENDQHMQVFESMSEIYYSLHLVDLKENTTVEYTSKNQVQAAFKGTLSQAADVTMKQIMKATMTDEYLERGLEFSDMKTVAERMRDKKIISMELLGKNVGWIRMSFITFEETDGLPDKIIVATQIIDEEKKKEEMLYAKSHIDELTGCHNRRAYNTDLRDYEECEEVKDFAIISFDVNGLKTVNDTLGHEAGDELIQGAVECMNKVFGNHGKIYRLGGDEFAGLITADEGLMKMLCKDFDQRISTWHGELVQSVSVSYGYVLSSEAEGKSMTELTSMADQRMYEAKSAYYKKNGIDRRRT